MKDDIGLGYGNAEEKFRVSKGTKKRPHLEHSDIQDHLVFYHKSTTE